MVLYLASNVSKEITYNSLRSLLGVGSANTVADYCEYLQESFLCFFINRYDFSLKKQLHFAKKIYFIDQAVAQVVGFRISEDRGRILENIVFLELKRRYKNIYFHRQQRECDFLIKEGLHITMAIQVCVQLNSDTTRQRELEGLIEALNMYNLKEGYIITENEETTEKIEHFTIHVIPIWKWLLN